MDYRRAWFALKGLIANREKYLKEKLKTDKKRTEDLTKGELAGLFILKQCMFEMESDSGEYRVFTEAEVTENLRQSVESYIPTITKESAREFLSKLSMYDENGQLIQ